MRKLFIIFLLFFNIQFGFSQVTNLRVGLWSDATLWNTNNIPSSNDSVFLQYDITIDVDASCKYLYTDGHSVNINSGVNLNIGTGSLPPAPLLRQFVILDTTQASPNDTLYTYSYTYDNLGRCSEIKVNDHETNKTGYTYNYYNGSDTLISWRKLVNQIYVDSVVEYFTYATDGIILSDSVIEYRNSGNGVINTHKYQVVDSFMYSDVEFGGNPLLKANYIIGKNGMGNIVSEKDSSFTYNGSFYSYRNTTNIAYSYDSAICPFYKLYPRRLTGLEYELITTDDVPFFLFLQKNNTTSEIFNTLPTTSGLGSHNENFTYIYNEAKYPVIVIYRDMLHGDVLKGMYYY